MGQVYDLDLKEREQSVLLAMADHADHEGGSVFPSFGRIAWKVGASYDTVQRAVKSLENLGILVPVNKQQGHATEYKIVIAAGKKKPDYMSKSRQRNTPPATCGTTSRNLRDHVNGDIQQTAGSDAAICGTTSRTAMRDVTIREPSGNHQKEAADKLRHDLSLFKIPEFMNKPEFVSALERWVRHRAETKKRITQTAAEQQMESLTEMGIERAIVAIKHSISGGYQGIFEPNDRNRKPAAIVADHSKDFFTGL